MKALDRFRLFGRFLVAVDATGYHAFTKRHCEKCLTQKQGDRTIYYHMALEAKLVTDSGLVMSLATEFIENADKGGDEAGLRDEGVPKARGGAHGAFARKQAFGRAR